MSIQEHIIDIEFDREEYVASLNPSLPGLKTPFSSHASFPVWSAVVNWLKVLERGQNQRPEDGRRFIIFRVHESAFRNDDTGWGTLSWATDWRFRQLIVDEAGVERHWPARYGSAVVLKLLEESGGSMNSSELVRWKTEDGDSIWNHLVGGQDETDLLGPLARSGVIAWDERGNVTLLDTKGNPVKL